MMMSELESIEKEIYRLKDEERKVCAAATANIKKQIEGLNILKSKKELSKKLKELELIKEVLPLCAEITSLAVEINQIGRFTLWVDFSGHVNKFTVRGHPGAYPSGADTKFRFCCYLNPDEKTSDFVQCCKRLREVIEILKQMISDKDFDPSEESDYL